MEQLAIEIAVYLRLAERFTIFLFFFCFSVIFIWKYWRQDVAFDFATEVGGWKLASKVTLPLVVGLVMLAYTYASLSSRLEVGESETLYPAAEPVKTESTSFRYLDPQGPSQYLGWLLNRADLNYSREKQRELQLLTEISLLATEKSSEGCADIVADIVRDENRSTQNIKMSLTQLDKCE
ncbi:hypothetical protein P5P81_21195 [Tritonibacter mobilis]|nr:hypothetical protein [Tritonibacter mobilis]